MSTSSILTKAELVNNVAATRHLLERDAELVVNAVLDGLVESLTAGTVELRGFGSSVLSIKRLASRPAPVPRRAPLVRRGGAATRCQIRRLRGLAEVPN